jgi:uncharacterized membrane protein YhhN
VALAVAVADWLAVGREARRAEAALKPLVPAILGVTAALGGSWWLAAALLLCLAGDVLLLPQVDRFRGGLAAFPLAHLAFIGGFLAEPPAHVDKLVYAPLILVLLIWVGPRLLRAAPRSERLPVLLYMVALAGLYTAAWLAARPAAVAGAILFVASDTLLAGNRFLGPLPGRRLAVMVTYHLALVLLTLSLVLR